ncbi:GNAT family N-acetyltransferase [Micromonospora sp. NPDC005203]|uniref:GNAT family N-acetyltransferase n=1 Tax=Micromonospora sp. NPDC005203 TaxID=3364226 RepID=UPI0036A28DF4
MPEIELRPFRPDDAVAVHALHLRHVAADHIDPHSTVAPLPDVDELRRRCEVANWAAVALDGSGGPVGWAMLISWTEDDGTTVRRADGYVAPPARRRGIGTRLLVATEAAARELAGEGVLAANASSVQPDRVALLQRHGYRRVFSLVEMVHDGQDRPLHPLPGGVAVRTATVGDAAALIGLTARAWAGRPFFIRPDEDGLRDWLARTDLSLFQVASTDNQLVGLVAAVPRAGFAEIVDVQTDPAFQRRGLASALVGRVVVELARRGAGPVRLHTEGDDPAGARSLYERLGFRTVREHGRYRKPASTPARPVTDPASEV